MPRLVDTAAGAMFAEPLRHTNMRHHGVGTDSSVRPTLFPAKHYSLPPGKSHYVAVVDVDAILAFLPSDVNISKVLTFSPTAIPSSLLVSEEISSISRHHT